ncbi:hypothetical protein B0J11DRAFT_484889 [Dendryphion nanum]|uniref:Required for respiratory growth protein 7, mitochondrial n=1 Tax=Dendryphion nanum TaxID=256645 RepID=A0A9P9IPY9_9PLEO|nr:hypothetical protein B0J11DRAFT_484889 [Dendryphion nanum]
MRFLLRPVYVQQKTWFLHCLRIHSRNIKTSTKPPAQVKKLRSPKLILQPGSKFHNSLDTFVEYAKRTNLAPTKTYYVGTHYEYTSADALLRLGFSVIRTGRKSDAGIDLIGHWILPQFLEPLPVIVQCKAFKARLAPRHIRELEGAFQGRPPEWRNKSVLGLLISTQKASRGVMESLEQHDRPLGFLKITEEGRIEQFLWNRAAGARGLEGLERDIVLTWMGTPIFPDREKLDEETLELGKQILGEELESEVMEPRKKRGRSRKAAVEPVGKMAKKIGRPPGSKSRTTKKADVEIPVPRKRGRPKGSKNRVDNIAVGVA